MPAPCVIQKPNGLYCATCTDKGVWHKLTLGDADVEGREVTHPDCPDGFRGLALHEMCLPVLGGIDRPGRRLIGAIDSVDLFKILISS